MEKGKREVKTACLGLRRGSAGWGAGRECERKVRETAREKWGWRCACASSPVPVVSVCSRQGPIKVIVTVMSCHWTAKLCFSLGHKCPLSIHVPQTWSLARSGIYKTCPHWGSSGHLGPMWRAGSQCLLLPFPPSCHKGCGFALLRSPAPKVEPTDHRCEPLNLWAK